MDIFSMDYCYIMYTLFWLYGWFILYSNGPINASYDAINLEQQLLDGQYKDINDIDQLKEMIETLCKQLVLVHSKFIVYILIWIIDGESNPIVNICTNFSKNFNFLLYISIIISKTFNFLSFIYRIKSNILNLIIFQSFNHIIIKQNSIYYKLYQF